MTQCQTVLEKCPQNCGVYITRQQRDFHLQKQCQRIKNNQNRPCQVTTTNNECICCEYCCKNITDFESELKIIQLRIDDERRNRLQFEYTWLNELSKLHERYQKNEEWRDNILTIFSSLQKNIYREEQIRKKEVDELNYKLDRISSALKNYETSINEMDEIMKETKTNCLSKSEELVERFDEWRVKQENRLASLRNLNTEFEKLRDDHVSRSHSMLHLLDINEVLIENQEQCSEYVKNCGKEIEMFKESLNEENYLVSCIWNKQLDHFKSFKADFEKMEEMLQELFNWQNYIKNRLNKIERKLKSENNALISSDYQNSITLYPTDTPIYSNGKNLVQNKLHYCSKQLLKVTP